MRRLDAGQVRYIVFGGGMAGSVRVPGGQGRAVVVWQGQYVPQPLNVFMDVRAGAGGTLSSRPASSRPGDYVTFQAAQDCLVVLSSCPMDIVPISSGGITPLELRVDQTAARRCGRRPAGRR